MEKCLLITLPREIPNAPFKYDDIIIKTYPIDTIYGTLILDGIAIDNIESPTEQDISNLDWTKTHFLKIHNKVKATTVRIIAYYNSSYRFSINLDDFIPCTNLSELDLNLQGYQSVYGNISSLINSKSLSFLKIDTSNLVSHNINGNLKDIVFNNMYNCNIRCGGSNEGTIICDIAELINSYKLRSLSIGNNTISCSNRTTRNSPIYSAIDGHFVFENDEDVENFLICNANCRWYYNDKAESRPNTLSITKDGYTPSADALTAIQNLKTNMYLYSTSKERTTGTYFTVKINGVTQ